MTTGCACVYQRSFSPTRRQTHTFIYLALKRSILTVASEVSSHERLLSSWKDGPGVLCVCVCVCIYSPSPPLFFGQLDGGAQVKDGRDFPRVCNHKTQAGRSGLRKKKKRTPTKTKNPTHAHVSSGTFPLLLC